MMRETRLLTNLRLTPISVISSGWEPIVHTKNIMFRQSTHQGWIQIPSIWNLVVNLGGLERIYYKGSNGN